MKGLKDFRRSLNKDRTSGGARPGAASSSLSNVKGAISHQPPKMVLKAVTDYKSRAPNELGFTKGDFFHVLTDPMPNAEWIEAFNPMSGARGLVPASAVEIVTKSSRPGQGGFAAAGPSAAGPSQSPAQRAAGAAMTAKGGGGLFATVKYDFEAERDDELGAKAGESMIIIAQSNFEWFVAKPIGRLGGPGLIPVAFVEIKDLATGRVVDNVEELISSGVVPKVEEWKKMTAEYKKNTIPLGRFDFGGGAGGGGAPAGAVAAMGGSSTHDSQVEADEPSPSLPPKDDKWGVPYAEAAAAAAQSQEQLPAGMPPGEPLPAGIITFSTVDSFHFEQGDYWFRLQAYHTAGWTEESAPTAPRAGEGEERDLILYRLYEDFYEFQIALLDHFPAEAGRHVDQNGEATERILPLMPGPLDNVDDYITAQRRGDLDQYIWELTQLPEYILRSELVRLFFEPRPGDHCATYAPGMRPRRSFPPRNFTKGKAPAHMAGGGDFGGNGSGDAVEEVRTPQPPYGNGTSKYSEESTVGAQSYHDRSASVSSRAPTTTGDLGSKMDSLSMGTRSSGHSASNSRSSGPGLQPPHSFMQRNASAATVETQGSRESGARMSSGAASASGGAASPSFMKIKIFNRANDDLVAIRVPPSVTHNQLMEKVRDRLGADINVLRYRDANPEPGASGMVRMHDDEDLREWLGSGAKLNLYADRT